mmetsp:Transcript_2885/g.4211  ORF Transcript_2885/g.4211 Transcript_2885/m.4211 type:complete len:477 (+) Transcript_2885:1002-2432(+)
MEVESPKSERLNSDGFGEIDENDFDEWMDENIAEENEDENTEELTISQFDVLLHTTGTKTAVKLCPKLETYKLKEKKFNFEFKSWAEKSLRNTDAEAFMKLLEGEVPSLNDMLLLSKNDLSPIPLLVRNRVWHAITNLKDNSKNDVKVEPYKHVGYLEDVYGRGVTPIPHEPYKNQSLLIAEFGKQKTIDVVWKGKVSIVIKAGKSIVLKGDFKANTKIQAIIDKINYEKQYAKPYYLVFNKIVMDPWGYLWDYLQSTVKTGLVVDIELIKELDITSKRTGHFWTKTTDKNKVYDFSEEKGGELGKDQNPIILTLRHSKRHKEDFQIILGKNTTIPRLCDLVGYKGSWEKPSIYPLIGKDLKSMSQFRFFHLDKPILPFVEKYQRLMGSVRGIVLDSACTFIFIKTLTGKTITIEFNVAMTTIDLKKMIRNKEGIPTDQQRIIFNGKNMEDTKFLSSGHGVNPGDTLHLILRLRGT